MLRIEHIIKHFGNDISIGFFNGREATYNFEEKQEGSLKRLLRMPVTRANFLWSKYFYFVLIGMMQLFTPFLFAYFLFDVEIFTNFFNLMVVILISAAAVLFATTLAGRKPFQYYV